MQRSPGSHHVEFASFRRGLILGGAGSDFVAERDDRSWRVFPNEFARLLSSGLSRAIPISRSHAASKAGTPGLGPGPWKAIVTFSRYGGNNTAAAYTLPSTRRLRRVSIRVMMPQHVAPSPRTGFPLRIISSIISGMASKLEETVSKKNRIL